MKKSPVFHPFLFSVIPILFLFAYNLKRFPLRLEELSIPLASSMILSVVLFLAVTLLLKDPHKGGFIVSAFFISFYLYGPVHDAVRYVLIGIWNDVVFVLCLSVWVMFLWKIASSIKAWDRLTQTLNVVGLILLVLNCASAGYALRQNSQKRVRPATVSHKTAADSPDIYFIILDGYARADVLKDLYHYDNREFIEFLTGKGFYVAGQSRANYCQSPLCLASILNLDYLDKLLPARLSGSSNRAPLLEMINHSAAADFLRGRGYEIVSFASGYFGAELKEADLYIDSERSLSEFQRLVIRATPLSLVIRAFGGKSGLEIHRDRVLNTLKKLPLLKKNRSPLFVVAHIVAPHPPFVFDKEGRSGDLSGVFLFKDGVHYHRMEPGRVGQYIENFREQTIFVTRRIRAAIGLLLANSGRKPVIILQSDPGPGAFLDWDDPEKTDLRERMSILNAVYLPEQNYHQLYERITPVNTFRAVFNGVFGAGYSVLPDRNFFSTWKQPYRFYDIDEFFVLQSTRAAER